MGLPVAYRELTESGFFTPFEDPDSSVGSDKNVCIPGPFIYSRQAPSGAMSLLCTRNGKFEFLEVLAMEDSESANDIVDFELGEGFYSV